MEACSRSFPPKDTLDTLPGFAYLRGGFSAGETSRSAWLGTLKGAFFLFACMIWSRSTSKHEGGLL